MLDDRLTFRLAPADLRHVAVIADHLRANTGTPFVSRTDVLRAALRGYAAVVADKAAVGAAS